MLKQKILDRNVRFGVIGLGYVGLPLAVEFAKVGMKVTGFEVDTRKVESLSMGESYIGDVPSSEVAPLVKRGIFSATTDFDELAQMDVISICVPTPLSKTRDPDMSYVVKATEEVQRRLRKGQLVILESTTYPGTTDELMKVELEKTGLKCGTDFYLAFSPERVDPSNPQYGVKNTPKLVGGVEEVSGDLAYTFYSQAIDRVMKLSSAAAAEMSKLLENTFRSVNIGLVNEMALMCDRLGLDVWEVIDGAATKPFGFMKFVPGPGVGGHCIPLDPFYLSWKLRTLNYRARFIELAGEINSEMPHYVVRLVSEGLNKDRKSVNGSRVLLLGVAYKNDVADMRESPALDILAVLEKEGAEVSYHDAYVPEFRHGDKSYKQVPLSEEELRKADCVVVTCKHKGVDWNFVAQHAKLIVDSRNAYPRNGKSPGPARIVKL
ncbi:MAG TPA: nucleotide sugar dehydrogenase [Planctomycetota bacterium]|nr:nucleotide sugar dehydrogenase [Planctomycetota bacterium]